MTNLVLGFMQLLVAHLLSALDGIQLLLKYKVRNREAIHIMNHLNLKTIFKLPIKLKLIRDTMEGVIKAGSNPNIPNSNLL